MAGPESTRTSARTSTRTSAARPAAVHTPVREMSTPRASARDPVPSRPRGRSTTPPRSGGAVRGESERGDGSSRHRLTPVKFDVLCAVLARVHRTYPHPTDLKDAALTALARQRLTVDLETMNRALRAVLDQVARHTAPPAPAPHTELVDRSIDWATVAQRLTDRALLPATYMQPRRPRA